MASTVDLALENLRWRVEAITPTHTRPGRSFEHVDPERHSPDASPICRWFTVRWTEETPQESADDVTDLAERVAVHTFELRVEYNHEYSLSLRQEIMLRDRHDLVKALRDPALFIGYGPKNLTDDIGLWSRIVTGVQLEQEYEDTDTMLYTVECIIREAE